MPLPCPIQYGNPTLVASARRHIYPANWVRALAALLVCCFHASMVLGLPKYLGSEPAPVFSAGFSGVQLFFVLSGFVIFLAHRDDPAQNKNAISNFIIKRFIRIYPMLWIVLLIILAAIWISSFAIMPSTFDIISAFLITPVERDIVLGIEWTLRHEILFYLIFSIFIWNRRAGTALLFLWGVVGSIVGMQVKVGWFLEFLLNSNHALFIMGIVAAWQLGKVPQWAASLSIICGLLIFLETYLHVLRGELYSDAYQIFFGFGSALLIHGLANLDKIDISIPILDLLGASSYSLYLIHLPLLSAMAKMINVIESYFNINHTIYFIALIVICQTLACIIYIYVEKPLLAWMQKLRRNV